MAGKGKGTHDKHLSVLDYKKEQRAKEIAVLETVKAEKENQVESQERRLKELAPAVKNMERLAADFSANPEEILPEPGTLETGRKVKNSDRRTIITKTGGYSSEYPPILFVESVK